MVLLILQQRTDETSDYCNPQRRQLWIQLSFHLLQKFHRGLRCQYLMSIPRDNASGAIISVITTRNVMSFMKQFVVVIYISTSTIALSTRDRASNYHWQ